MEELNKSLGERRREINNLQKKGEARYETTVDYRRSTVFERRKKQGTCMTL
jgi:hypothetical protein